MEGSKDVEELPNLIHYESDFKIIKTRTNSFLHTDLDDILKRLDVDTVVVSGYSTNKCVGITSIEACERDYQVILSGDATLGPRRDKIEAMGLILRTYGIEPESNKNIINKIRNEVLRQDAGGNV